MCCKNSLMLRFFICLLFVFSQKVFSQNKDDLEKEKKRLEKEVNLTRDLLNSARKNRKKSLNEANLLESQIQVRERIVNNLGSQVKSLDVEIFDLTQIILALEKDIFKLQDEYAKAAYVVYKNHNEISSLLWLLSAESFDQAYQRLKYFQQFSKFKNDQIALIKRTQSYLLQRKLELEGKKINKSKIIDEKLSESQKLDLIKAEKKELANLLKSKETEYREEIKQKRNSLSQIQNAIEGLVTKETTTTTEEVKEVNKPLSKLFEKNKGRLPWPIAMSKGVITGRFGVQKESGGVVTNNGIYITTEENQPVRAVFGGKVTAIQTLPIFGKVVIIQHGNYRSVYANLENVKVNINQEIDALDEIANVKTNIQSGDTQLHFLIYDGKTPLNPASWITPK